MALIVEDGTGVAGAESPQSVADADLWLASTGKTVSGTDLQKEGWCRIASLFMEGRFGIRLEGYRSFPATQGLSFPRVGAYRQVGSGFRWPIQPNEMPVEWLLAHAELYYRASLSQLVPDTPKGGAVIVFKVGPIEQQFQPPGDTPGKNYEWIDLLLSPIIGSNTGQCVRG